MSWHTPSTDLGTHICVKLINLVKQHPLIYQSSKELAPYPRKNRNEINQIWANIARDIGLSVEDCKRRWKGLKDVYAKIRKRRLEEGFLGISPRKKWLYEEFMSFMKFPFEKPYQKALENSEEIDCSEWKIDDVESNDIVEEALNDTESYLASTDSKFKDKLKVNVQEQEQIEDGTIEYLDLDLEVDAVPDTEAYVSWEKEDNPSEIIKVSTRKRNAGRGAKLKPQSRYRAIRPKPYQSNLLGRTRAVRSNNAVIKNSTGAGVPIVSASALSPLNQIIVSNPAVQKIKNCNAVILRSQSTKVRNCGREASDAISSNSAATVKLERFENQRLDSSPASNKNESFLRFSTKKSSTSSVELFFQSMAQTVMNLPMRAQAEIKMAICKVVTRAEIQYTLSQSTLNLESHKSKSKKG